MSLSKQFLVGLAFFLLPNIGMIFVASFYSLARPYLNIDYVLAMFVFLFVGSRVGFFVIAFALLVDALSLAGQLFPFIRFQDVLYLLGFLFWVPSGYLGLLIAVCANLVLVVFVFNFLSVRFSRLGFLVCLLLALSLFSLEKFSGEGVRGKFWKPAEAVAASQLENFVAHRLVGFASRFWKGGEAFIDYPESAATDSWRDEIKQGVLNEKLLLIIVESWGVPHDQTIQDELLKPLASSVSANLQYGEMEFSGATVAGEFRELCRLYPLHFNLRSVEGQYSNCLPNLLREKGYVTKAMHGAMSTMYDRRYWYPRAGLSESVFFEDRAWPRRCYSFPGACDVDMFEELKIFFDSNDEGLFYWLTLNSHASYDLRDLFDIRFDCAEFGIGEGESCRNLMLHAQFFYRLSEHLKIYDNIGLDVIIVSDHEPRILDQAEFNHVFERGKVPWLRLTF